MRVSQLRGVIRASILFFGAVATVLALRVQSVQALLRAALDLDGGRYAQLYGFVRALRSRPLTWAAAPGEDGVHLLTIHGAKGLEA